MNLPSFLWLWKIAAWSMGLTLLTYGLMATTGYWMRFKREHQQPRPPWLRPTHYTMGIILVALILLLLSIGIVGTLGHYGSLGHSRHLWAGLSVTVLVLMSAVTGMRIDRQPTQNRSLHIATNLLLLFGLVSASLSGWQVVQKYLPKL